MPASSQRPQAHLGAARAHAHPPLQSHSQTRSPPGSGLDSRTESPPGRSARVPEPPKAELRVPRGLKFYFTKKRWNGGCDFKESGSPSSRMKSNDLKAGWPRTCKSCRENTAVERGGYIVFRGAPSGCPWRPPCGVCVRVCDLRPRVVSGVRWCVCVSVPLCVCVRVPAFLCLYLDARVCVCVCVFPHFYVRACACVCVRCASLGEPCACLCVVWDGC